MSKQVIDNIRDSVTIIVSPVRGTLAIHFCAIPSLQGEECELWWPVMPESDLHQVVETILITNGIACNVTRLEKLREQGKSIDFLVIFNRVI